MLCNFDKFDIWYSDVHVAKTKGPAHYPVYCSYGAARRIVLFWVNTMKGILPWKHHNARTQNDYTWRTVADLSRFVARKSANFYISFHVTS